MKHADLPAPVDQKGIYIPPYIAARKDIRPDDKMILSLILATQNNPHNRCFMSQNTMAQHTGLSRKIISLCIARLTQSDQSRKNKQGPTYSLPLIHKRHAIIGKKKMLTYWALTSKDSPLWWLKEDSEGRSGIADIRTKSRTKNTQPQPKTPNVIPIRQPVSA